MSFEVRVKLSECIEEDAEAWFDIEALGVSDRLRVKVETACPCQCEIEQHLVSTK